MKNCASNVILTLLIIANLSMLFNYQRDDFKSSKGEKTMAAKVMGVTAGRKNSNSEILLKEALMRCEELGAEVTMINLKDYHI